MGTKNKTGGGRGTNQHAVKGTAKATPHMSAESDVDEQVRFAILRENLRRYVAGEKMLSVVDVAKGY